MSGDGKYNVHHFVDNNEIGDCAPRNYGLLEIEEMHDDVREEADDLRSGNAGADPEGKADWYRDRTKGLWEACHGLSVEEVEEAVKLCGIFKKEMSQLWLPLPEPPEASDG